jgi:hypothetical protein
LQLGGLALTHDEVLDRFDSRETVAGIPGRLCCCPRGQGVAFAPSGRENSASLSDGNVSAGHAADGMSVVMRSSRLTSYAARILAWAAALGLHLPLTQRDMVDWLTFKRLAM